ncbi:hypothetical protein [Flindersiella endophytica]
MTTYWFPDNTVLCNFAAVDRLDLLRAILAERGRWVEAIAHEARRSSRIHAGLATIAREGWLGKPISIGADFELAEIENLRVHVFGGRSTQPLKHLGEAQTCYILKHWPEFEDSRWITDDREALRYARRQGIVALDTCDLIDEGIVARHLTSDEGRALLRKMADNDRHVRTR